MWSSLLASMTPVNMVTFEKLNLKLLLRREMLILEKSACGLISDTILVLCVHSDFAVPQWNAVEQLYMEAHVHAHS